MKKICCIYAFDTIVFEISHLNDDDDDVFVGVSGDAAVCRQLRKICANKWQQKNEFNIYNKTPQARKLTSHCCAHVLCEFMHKSVRKTSQLIKC